MSEPVKMSADEKKWRADNDARTLAEAEVIQKDKARLKAAKAAAKSMADEKRREATAMTNVAGALYPEQGK